MAPNPSFDQTNNPIPRLNPNAPSFSLNPGESSQAPTNHPKPWNKKLFSLNHIPELQRLLFSPPVRKGDKDVAICSKEEVNKTEEKWKDAIHGFFASKRPFFPSILSALKKSQKVKEFVEIFHRPDESIIFIFSSLEERNRVLSSGPWFIHGRYLHHGLDWFDPVRSSLRLCLFGYFRCTSGSIGKIIYVVGKPLYLNDISANSSKIWFVRVCVELSATRPPPIIQVEVEGSDDPPFDQAVEYKSSFKICEGCKVFGHVEGDYSKAVMTSSSRPNPGPKATSAPVLQLEETTIGSPDHSKIHANSQLQSIRTNVQSKKSRAQNKRPAVTVDHHMVSHEAQGITRISSQENRRPPEIPVAMSELGTLSSPENDRLGPLPECNTLSASGLTVGSPLSAEFPSKPVSAFCEPTKASLFSEKSSGDSGVVQSVAPGRALLETLAKDGVVEKGVSTVPPGDWRGAVCNSCKRLAQNCCNSRLNRRTVSILSWCGRRVSFCRKPPSCRLSAATP